MISMETTSPRTAPIRLATAPSAPGRSGSSMRTRKVAIGPGYVGQVNSVFRVEVAAVTGPRPWWRRRYCRGADGHTDALLGSSTGLPGRAGGHVLAVTCGEPSCGRDDVER